MKKLNYYLPELKFEILVSNNDYDIVKKKIDESIILYKDNSNKVITIKYIANEDIFEKLLKEIKPLEGKIYNSFKNQTHKEVILDGKKYYLVNSEEYICQMENKESYIIYVKQNTENSANWIVRIIRELYLREKENTGYYFMHGTALMINNKGVMLLGTSGSGKTTLAVKLLDTDINTKFLSNDRVFVNEKLDMEYFPQAVTYAMGTVKNNTKLDKYFRNNRILENKKNINYENATNEMDCNTPLTDVEKIFENTEMISKAKLNYIIYPRLYVDYDETEMLEMDENEKKKLLDITNFTPYDTESLRKPWIMKRNLSDKELIKNKRKFEQTLIKNVKIIKLKYGAKTNAKKIIKELEDIR